MDVTEKLAVHKCQDCSSQPGYGGEQLVLQVVDLLTKLDEIEQLVDLPQLGLVII